MNGSAGVAGRSGGIRARHAWAVALFVVIGLMFAEMPANAATGSNYMTNNTTCNIYLNQYNKTWMAHLYVDPPAMWSMYSSPQDVSYQAFLYYWGKKANGTWDWIQTSLRTGVYWAKADSLMGTNWGNASDTSFLHLGAGWFGFTYRTLVQMKWYWNGSVVQTVNAWNDVHTQQFWTASGSGYYGISGSWCTVPVSG